MSTEFGIFVGIWAVAFVINLIASIFVANFASRKGRSWAAFFWLSLLFSVVVMAIIVAVMNDSPSSTAGPTRDCPECAEKISAKAKLCKHCQSKVTPLPAAELVTERGGPGKGNGLLKLVGSGLVALGVLWIATYYVTSAQFPFGVASPVNLGNFNILLGFVVTITGVVALIGAAISGKRN